MLNLSPEPVQIVQIAFAREAFGKLLACLSESDNDVENFWQVYRSPIDTGKAVDGPIGVR